MYNAFWQETVILKHYFVIFINAVTETGYSLCLIKNDKKGGSQEQTRNSFYTKG